MGLFDVEGFGERPEIQLNLKPPKKEVFQENAFDRTIVEDVSPLVKMKVINSRYNLGGLLRQLGHNIDASNLYCPFHPDEATGKPSAKYHPDTDLLYCFSEHKMYSAYHALKLLYGIDTNRVFQDIWSKLSIQERQAFLDSNGQQLPSIQKHQSQWEFYKTQVLDKFKNNQVNFRQYKNALYKVLMSLRDEAPKPN